MTFRKPSTETNVTGAYTYKKGVSSSSFNYIDNAFPDLLDKTGDDVATGGGISGEIDVLSGGEINFLSGSNLEIQNLAGLTFINGSQVFGGIVFADGESPEIAQTPTAASANDMNINAQSTSINSGTGGALNLNAGGCSGTAGIGGQVFIESGGGSAANGEVVLATPSASVQLADKNLTTNMNGQVSQVNAWIGSSSATQPQRKTNYTQNFYIVQPGAPVNIGTGITLANNSAANIEVSWISRDTSTGVNFFAGNKFLIIAHCNNSGVIANTALITGSNFVAPTGNYADASTWFTISTSSNNLQLASIQPSGVSFEISLQIVITVSYI